MQSHKDKHDLVYYLKCMGGGVFACGLRILAVPIDVVKCRTQVLKKTFSLKLIKFLLWKVSPNEYPSFTAAFSKIKSQEGVKAFSLV